MAGKGAYCEEHLPPQPHGWDTSKRTKPRGWDRLRLRILKRDGFKCVMCGDRANVVDHYLPTAWGGAQTDWGNLRAMCRPCHKSKTKDESRLGRKFATLTPSVRAAEIQRFLARWRPM